MRLEENEFELTKRRLVDEIRDSVRKQLLGTFGLAFTAVMAVLGYMNYNIIVDLRLEAKSSINKLVYDEFEKVKGNLEELTREIFEQTGKIRGESERAGVVQAEVNKQLRVLDIESLNLANLNDSVSGLEQARRQVEIDLGEIQARIDILSTIAEQLDTIAEKLQQVDPENFGTYQAVINQLEESRVEEKALLDRPTVFLQFAGGTRRRAEELAAKIAEQGFVMPGEERHGGAAGKREIRYFFSGDLEKATRLKAALETALEELEFPAFPAISVKDYSDFSGAKPRAGVLELWIEV